MFIPAGIMYGIELVLGFGSLWSQRKEEEGFHAHGRRPTSSDCGKASWHALGLVHALYSLAVRGALDALKSATKYAESLAVCDRKEEEEQKEQAIGVRKRGEKAPRKSAWTPPSPKADRSWVRTSS